ncbi:hypothetical protein NP233_g12460 [Leucocoprinus birnbaumii]|uniref:Berberine/berberine-like domain-containing protein n=1 Tax=Leucocoprinus birnbaumii TaxID=56174 RepID=A0AAD5YKE8_9AGAR|nr:hypothetical protein NP233_g12460 [Leucocoprinus birnbaumii]
MLMMTTAQPDGTPIIICNIFYNGSEEEGRANYKKLYDIGPVADGAKEIPYESVNTLVNPMVVHRNGVYWKGVAHDGPDFEIVANAHQKIVEIMKGGKFMASAIYEWIPLKKINSVPFNSTAYRRNPKPNCLILLGWLGSAHTAEMVDGARILTHEIATCVAGEANLKDSSKTQGYANYDPEGVKGDGDEVKDKGAIAFGDNYPRLQKIKRKYDPESVFNRWFAITPA